MSLQEVDDSDLETSPRTQALSASREAKDAARRAAEERRKVEEREEAAREKAEKAKSDAKAKVGFSVGIRAGIAILNLGQSILEVYRVVKSMKFTGLLSHLNDQKFHFEDCLKILKGKGNAYYLVART